MCLCSDATGNVLMRLFIFFSGKLSWIPFVSVNFSGHRYDTVRQICTMLIIFTAKPADPGRKTRIQGTCVYFHLYFHFINGRIIILVFTKITNLHLMITIKLQANTRKKKSFNSVVSLQQRSEYINETIKTANFITVLMSYNINIINISLNFPLKRKFILKFLVGVLIIIIFIQGKNSLGVHDTKRIISI